MDKFLDDFEITNAHKRALSRLAKRERVKIEDAAEDLIDWLPDLDHDAALEVVGAVGRLMARREKERGGKKCTS